MPLLHVALVEPEIHWNTGNAGRSCLAFGAQLHLVGPLGFSLDERQVRRAGLDYWDRVAPILHPDFATFEAQMARWGEPLFFSAEAERTLGETPLPTRCLFVFGGESRGLPADVRARYRERLVRIPILPGSVRSLNLSTCVGIALHEAVGRPR
ncbi:MAG: tRNA (cytidine(34)-2'-O)-methyltransferase [Planctomycetes bacterium]|nr:tRNA (cytidine(34)-2'-O)-methyltransferase [Planctomycetota bacterium]